MDKVDIQRVFIQELTKPFCIIDMYVWFEVKHNYTNRNMLLSVLDELVEDGLVVYGQYPVTDPSSSEWAFCVI